MDMKFLHEGVPQMSLKAKWAPVEAIEAQVHEAGDMTESLKKVLGRYNVCSKEYFVRQYDHEVQGGSVVKPLTGAANDGPSDAGVLRPVLSSFEGLAVANGICPKFSADAYAMAACAVDEAVRNAVAVGADVEHMAALDNFSWCDPLPAINNADAPEKLGKFAVKQFTLYRERRNMAEPGRFWLSLAYEWAKPETAPRRIAAPAITACNGGFGTARRR